MIDWQAFHFIRPEWLLALIPLLLVALLFKHFKQSSSGWHQLLPSHLHATLLTGERNKSEKKYALPISGLMLAWTFATIALAGPTWERLPQPVYNVKQGSVLVLDMSLSMRATDLTPDRLTRARFKAIDLVDSLADGEVGMVAYAGDAFIISPLTEDASNLINLIPSVSPEIMPIPGSEPIRGFEVASDLLSNAGYKTGDIYWFTDGVEPEQFRSLATFAESSPFKIHTLMIGTQDGAPIKQSNGELLKDARGAIVIPQSNPRELRALASRSGGAFARVSANDDDIQTILASPSISSETQIQQEDNELLQGDVWQDMGVYLAVLILPFAAYAFRRGLIMALSIITLGFFTISLPSEVYAQQNEPAESGWYQRMFKTPNQLGEDAFEAQDYQQAAEQFDDPMWQGAAHYRNQNFEAALQSFQSAQGLEAIYNQGNALAKLGQLKEAIDAYEQVLEQQPDHQHALENKALLEQLMQQQEEQEQQQNDQQNNQQQDSQQSDQSESSSQQDQQQSGEQSQSESGEQNEQQNDSQQQQDSAAEQQGQSDSSQSKDPSDAQMRENEAPPPAEKSNEQSQQQATQSEQQQSDAQTPPEMNSLEQSDQPLTEEQKEQLQRMQTLLRKVPDDPAFLLQRKMQLENQSRLRERAPPKQQKNW